MQCAVTPWPQTSNSSETATTLESRAIKISDGDRPHCVGIVNELVVGDLIDPSLRKAYQIRSLDRGDLMDGVM